MGLLESLVGQEIFLTGKYLDLGINSSGTLGTKATAPAGFVTDAVNGYIRLGMLGDTDGFGTGAAATRDVMLAGTPVETFSIGYDIGSKHYVNTNSERDGVVDIANGKTTNLSDSSTARAGWTGTTDEGVKVSQVMSLTSDAKFVRVDVTLTNTTASTLTDLRYMRSIDPDQGPTFSTNNVIVEQGGDTSGGALVAAYASKTSTPFYFYSQDERAIVSTYGFENRDPYAAAAHDTPQAKGYTLNGDYSVNIDFGLGSLKAGASTTITYYMGVTNDLAATVSAINAASGSTSPPPPPPVNHAPVAADDTLTVATGLAGSGNVLTNDTDADKDALHATLKTGAAHGTVTVADNGAFKYTSAAGYSGSDSFTYTVSDGDKTDIGTVNITVTPPVNHAPVAVDDSLTVAAGASGTGNVLTNDTDADKDTLHASIATNAAHGAVTVSSDGSFKYTPTAGYSGSDSFTYTVSDGKASDTGTVKLTVNAPQNHAPAAVDDSLSVAAGASGSGNVLTNDTDADKDVLHASLKTGAGHGVVTIASDGSYKYVPTAGYAGTDTFTYTVSDGSSTDVGTVHVTVNAPSPAGDPLLSRAGTLDLSDADSQTLTAASGHNTVYVDTAASSGEDKINGFGTDDVLAVTAKIYDGNNDGIIVMKSGHVSIDGAGSSDAVDLIGVGALRLLGQADDGLFVYANNATRLNGSIEGTLGNDKLAGDAGDKQSQTFLFDTALGLNLGADHIANFGAKDILVTTSALQDSNHDGIILFGSDKQLNLDSAGAEGAIGLTGTSGSPLSSIGFDGSFVQNHVTYYVYSTVGTHAGAAILPTA